MDLAYDHIVEESLPKEEDGKRKNSGAEQTQQSLNDEIQDAYKAFSASPWGAKIGGFFGNVVKQVCLQREGGVPARTLCATLPSTWSS